MHNVVCHAILTFIIYQSSIYTVLHIKFVFYITHEKRTQVCSSLLLLKYSNGNSIIIKWMRSVSTHSPEVTNFNLVDK